MKARLCSALKDDGTPCRARFHSRPPPLPPSPGARPAFAPPRTRADGAPLPSVSDASRIAAPSCARSTVSFRPSLTAPCLPDAPSRFSNASASPPTPSTAEATTHLRGTPLPQSVRMRTSIQQAHIGMAGTARTDRRTWFKPARKLHALAVVVFLLSFASLARAQHKPKDEECLACHADPTLTTTDASGRTVSLTVDAEKFKQSIHGSMFSCVDCHKDVKSSPHATTPAKIACAQCHADAQAAYQHSFHATAKKPDGSPAATCVDCHGDAHSILPASRPEVAGESLQYSRNLRHMPRAEVFDAVDRRQLAGLRRLSGQRPRTRGAERLADRRGLHGLPWLA